MAGLLEPLTPLASLISQSSDPDNLVDELITLINKGSDGQSLCEALAISVTDGSLARSVLAHSGVLDGGGRLTAESIVRLEQVKVILELTAANHWELVLTVPSFLRPALQRLVTSHGDAQRPRETKAVIADVARSSRRKLVIAAPYLHSTFVESLTAPIERLLRSGGTVTIITRALSLTAPERSSANVEAVARLRQAAGNANRPITIRSWEEDGLGVHFKTVIADDELAYLGSANMTPSAINAQAEAGVLLHGSKVAVLGAWMEGVAQALGHRRLPSA